MPVGSAVNQSSLDTLCRILIATSLIIVRNSGDLDHLAANLFGAVPSARYPFAQLNQGKMKRLG